ncbi:MAG: ImmA/IrrE family metallo-endopeptidase [Dehalococcoidia bacterium]
MLVPLLDGGFEILVDPSVVMGPSPEIVGPVVEEHRFRFRVAHEIGHSFFYDRKYKPAKRLLEPSKQEEAFCDHFASALLVPPRAVLGMPALAKTVLTIRQKYGVSAEVAGRALARAHPKIAVIGLLWRQNPRDGVGGTRVVWSGGPYFVPVGARLFSTVIEEARVKGKGNGLEQLKVGGLKGWFSVDAVRPVSGTQVVAVVKPAGQPEIINPESG